MGQERRVIVLSLLLCFFLWGCSGPGMGEGGKEPFGLVYEVKITDPAEKKVQVTAFLHWLPQVDLALPLEMAERYAFVRLDAPRIEGDVHAHDGMGNALPMARSDPFHWTVQTRGNTRIQLEYTVPLDHWTLPEVQGRDEYEHPYLDGDHGLLVAGTLFMVPDLPHLAFIKVSFLLPEGWEVLCPWEPDGHNAFAPGDRRMLFDDLMAVGRWSIHEQQVGGMEITTAFAPGQAELEEKAAPVIQEVVSRELELFHMTPHDRYLFLFVKPVMPGSGGSPKSGSMALTVNMENCPDHVPRLIAHLVGHEFFHLWSSARFECPDELRFFNEGFTDYYAYQISARAGFHSWADFTTLLEGHMANCEMNPLAGEIALTEAGGDLFFTDQNAYNLIYQGGLLAAALLELELAAAGPDRSLDQFMRLFINDPRWSPGETAPTLDDFMQCAGQHLSPGAAARYAAFIETPHTWNVEKAFREAGLSLTRKVGEAQPDLRGNLDGTRLLDLDPSGLAYRLGVRAGDRFLEVNDTAPKTARQVYDAWASPCSERIHVKLERAGEILFIDLPLPEVVEYRVDPPFQEKGSR